MTCKFIGLADSNGAHDPKENDQFSSKDILAFEWELGLPVLPAGFERKRTVSGLPCWLSRPQNAQRHARADAVCRGSPCSQELSQELAPELA